MDERGPLPAAEWKGRLVTKIPKQIWDHHDKQHHRVYAGENKERPYPEEGEGECVAYFHTIRLEKSVASNKKVGAGSLPALGAGSIPALGGMDIAGLTDSTAMCADFLSFGGRTRAMLPAPAGTKAITNVLPTINYQLIRPMMPLIPMTPMTTLLFVSFNKNRRRQGKPETFTTQENYD